MEAFPKYEPLTDSEWDRLDEFLGACKSGKVMNVEELDGFFTALIAGPDTVMPSEYYPHIFGGAMEDACEFETLEDANAILRLLMRHWNTITVTLYQEGIYLPMLLEDDSGATPANDWARGFMRGVELRHESWAELIASKQHRGSIQPIMTLCHEHDLDPEMRPIPITPERREVLIDALPIGVMWIFDYYRDQRGVRYSGPPTFRREAAKVGRNEPCDCGSGKKYKHCHGRAH